MADEPATQDGAPASGRMKTILLVAAMLIVEAGLILGAMMVFGGDPEVATADATVLAPDLTNEERIVEVLVLDAKLPNARSGVAYLYSTEIYVQVKQRNSPFVAERVQQFYNEIKAEVTAVWRTAEPHHFQEPKLENLTRKMYAMLNQRFGVDAVDGDPVVVKCVIVMGTGFRVDR